MIFSDESKIELNPERREYVRRPNNQRYNPHYTSKTVKFGGKSLMVWGAIKYDGTRALVKCDKSVTSEEYQRILDVGLLPMYQPNEPLQQDGTPCYRSKKSFEFLKK